MEENLVENTPLVTVLMSVYNGENYLSEAIDSILNQTFSDFEFLIINDCSTDNSADIINVYNDKRISQITNSKNLGLTKNLNKGILHARGKYIARMDADDISEPERLETQVKYMEDHHEVGACGTWSKVFSMADEKIIKSPESHDEIIIKLLRSNQLSHPSVMIRKSILLQYKLRYNESIRYAQDYWFWYQISQFAKLANISKPLLRYRKHTAQISTDKKKEQMKSFTDIRANIWSSTFNLDKSDAVFLTDLLFLESKRWSIKSYLKFRSMLKLCVTRWNGDKHKLEQYFKELLENKSKMLPRKTLAYILTKGLKLSI